jgi:hypothetical protein
MIGFICSSLQLQPIITAHTLNFFWTNYGSCLKNAVWRISLKNSWVWMSLSLILRPTVNRPVHFGLKHTFGAYDQIFITVRQFRVCLCGALSLMRPRVCRLQFLLFLASATILGFECHGTRNHILLSQIRDFPFCRLLRLAGLLSGIRTSLHTGENLWLKSPGMN